MIYKIIEKPEPVNIDTGRWISEIIGTDKWINKWYKYHQNKQKSATSVGDETVKTHTTPKYTS